VVEQQLRRYFIGIISFGFVVTWIAVGTVAAFLALLGMLLGMAAGPALRDVRRSHRGGRRRHVQRRAAPRVVTARAFADEDAELPLVPDEPSLIIGVSN
jgi:amino acid transporter